MISSDNNAEGKIEGFEVVRRSFITNTPCRRCVRDCEHLYPSPATGHHHQEGYDACWKKCKKNECSG
ncbi:BQ5605_C009g05738 [Microbotryum silenes-dioicae]|uniref:BQ5605_C009g05738 protein n=1 Tax=Microbotryum silenes-dioicae TaxID=796604 RepID=A0A2X0N7R2_9BASI|nr:BQ5605_C009g05738 [Microbotryum silenes-dioicae]